MKSNTKLSLAVSAALVTSVGLVEGATPYQNAVLADNPLLYWTFDEAGNTDNAQSLVNTEAANSLVAANGATRVGSTTTAGGLNLGRAADFSAAANSQFVAADLSDTSMPTVGITQFAYEFWVNLTADGFQDYILETFTEGGVPNSSSIIYGFNAGQLEFFNGTRSETSMSMGQWHHVVMAHYGGGANDVEIYIDGSSVGVTGAYSGTQHFGLFSLGATGVAGFGITGQLDEFALYDLGGLADDQARRDHVEDIAGHYSLVPEPTTGLLVGLSALGLCVRRRLR